MSKELTNEAVAAFVNAINSGDRDAFFALLTDDATMADDGTERDLVAWVDKEVFSADGRMDVHSVSADGLELTADYTNSTFGRMRTSWKFTVDGSEISRFETSQA